MRQKLKKYAKVVILVGCVRSKILRPTSFLDIKAVKKERSSEG
jgi:hypothetical protein